MARLVLYILFFVFTTNSRVAYSSVISDIKGKNIFTGANISYSFLNEKNKGIVVVFMSSKCPCSNSHVPIIKKLSKDNPEFKFIIVHSNFDENELEAKKYFQESLADFDVIQDDNNKIANQFKAFKTPHSFLINPKGEILYQGGITSSTKAQFAERNYLAEAIDDVVKKQKVRTPEGRTLGCVIMREGDKNVW